MVKWFVRGGLGLLTAVIVLAGYLAFELFWPARFTPPARIMPSGAVAYLALDHLETGWRRVETSRWWQGLARQLESDGLIRRHLERLRRELSQAWGMDITRANLMSLLGRHASLALYPARSGPGWPGLGGLDWLVALKIDHRLILLKWFMDVRGWLSSRSDLKYLRRRGRKIGRIQTDAGPMFFWLRGDHTAFLSDRLDLIEAVLARLEAGGPPGLTGDAVYKKLDQGRPGQIRLRGFLRLGHPRLAAWRQGLAGLLAARMPPPAHPSDLMALPAPLVLALYHPRPSLESVDVVRFGSDLVHTSLVWTLRSGSSDLGRIYAQVIDPADRLRGPDLLKRSPLLWIEHAGLRADSYLAATGWHPLARKWLNRYAPLLGFGSARKMLELTGREFAVLVADLRGPGFLPVPNIVALVRMKDSTSARKMYGRILTLIKAHPHLASRLKKRAGPRFRIDYLAYPGINVGLTVAGSFLVAGNDLSRLNAAQGRPGLTDDDPGWRAAVKDRGVQYLLFVSPGRILARPERLIPVLNLLGMSSRDLPFWEIFGVVDWLTVTSRWDGRHQVRLDVRLNLVDRPVKGRLPLGLIQRWLAGIRIYRPQPVPRRSAPADRLK
jgi:hypothetical protein